MRYLFAKRHWIPPWALLFAQAAHGVSWLLLLAVAYADGVPQAVTPSAVAWIHIVALGWFTVAALAILLQIIPGTTDLSWRGEGVARGGLGVVLAGVALFVASWLTNLSAVAPAALVLFAGLAVYLGSALHVLSGGKDLERTERAIARAFSITLMILAVVAVLGALMAAAVSGYMSPRLLLTLPASHALLAFWGWLALLIFGVSARTMKPICGIRTLYPKIHIIVGSATLGGAAFLCIGAAIASQALLWAGAVLAAIGALAFTFDIATILAHATQTHRPPQAFVASSLFWLVVSLALGGATLVGAPLGAAYGFAMLIGFVGQMVNGHMLHIGIRVVATLMRGENDETEPIELLDARLSWAAFAGMQLAMTLCIYALCTGNRVAFVTGAGGGLAAWVLLIVNFAISVNRAARVMVIRL